MTCIPRKYITYCLNRPKKASYIQWPVTVETRDIAQTGRRNANTFYADYRTESFKNKGKLRSLISASLSLTAREFETLLLSRDSESAELCAATSLSQRNTQQAMLWIPDLCQDTQPFRERETVLITLTILRLIYAFTIEGYGAVRHSLEYTLTGREYSDYRIHWKR